MSVRPFICSSAGFCGFCIYINFKYGGPAWQCIYMGFQMGPLTSIFQSGEIFTINLNTGLFRPFQPQSGEFGWSGLDITNVRDLDPIIGFWGPKFESSKASLEIFQYYIFGEFSFATPPGVWDVFDLWFLEEWTNQIIHQSTNIIFENHFKAIWFAPKHIKKNSTMLNEK